MLLLSAFVAVTAIFLIWVWSRPTAQARPPQPGAFSLSDPVHLLAVILVGVLVLALVTC